MQQLAVWLHRYVDCVRNFGVGNVPVQSSVGRTLACEADPPGPSPEAAPYYFMASGNSLLSKGLLLKGKMKLIIVPASQDLVMKTI